MKQQISKGPWIIIALTMALLAAPALADKPEWAGKGKNKKNDHAEQRNDDRGGRHEGKRQHFKDDDRSYVRDYYQEQYRGGKCPPGLAKKNNGCMPPGQAKKWAYGRPLPRDVVYYPVPQPVIVRIGPPPSGYKYVRVASDILMIAIGTGMVVDAITDLGRM
jgi:Ni/Co efflux regulator RcnB